MTAAAAVDAGLVGVDDAVLAVIGDRRAVTPTGRAGYDVKAIADRELIRSLDPTS